MKTIKLLVLYLFAFLIFYTCISDKHKIKTKIDRLFEDYQGSATPGAVVCVIKNSEIEIIRSYGMGHIENNQPIRPETNFRLASVTKQFTAMAVMQLVQRNKLRFNQNLVAIFEDFPDYGNKVTVEHLLHHTSGLIDYESLIPDSATVQVTDLDVLNMMKSQDSLYFEPGSAYRYSNSGYAVLAMIIEKISGITFSQYLNKNIFEPLDMSGTVAFRPNENDVVNRSYGYALTDSGFIFKDQSLTSAVLGDGGIYSNAPDLLKWDKALYADKLLGTELLKQAFLPDTLHNGEVTGYGFGWRIDQYKDLKRIHHTGSTCGFRNAYIRFPDIRLSVIILTNRDKPDVLNLAENISDLYLEH